MDLDLQTDNSQAVNTNMAKFNLFRLSCMLDDADGAKFNKVLVSVICDYIYQRDNEHTPLSECYNYLVRELGIMTTKHHLKRVIDKVDYVLTEQLNDDILLYLEVETYDKLCHSSDSNSIEFYAKEFLKQESLPESQIEVLVNIIHQSIYENIQGIAGGNVKSLLAEEIKGKFPPEDIDLFNRFLDFDSRAKDNAIFKLFYKALEFAIATSGRGVEDFAQNIFKGKIYLLDTNVIFDLMGIHGVQERANSEQLMSACLHQGVDLRYSHQTYAELTRKRTQAIEVLKRFNNKADYLVEETIINGEIRIRDGFANQYFSYKKIGLVSTPDQYELKLITEFKQIEKNYKLQPVSNSIQITKKETEQLTRDFFEEKRARHNRNYTGTAAHVDAHNIMYVRKARAINNFNFSDVKCFYLSTDWTLSEILKNENEGQAVNEILLPAQAFLLHATLTNSQRNVDFVTFTKFLKKNIVGQELSGVQVVRYVNQISNLTTDPQVISSLLRAYSDKRYTNTYNDEAELILPTFSEFAKTELDAQLASARQKAVDTERESALEVERVRIIREQEAKQAQLELANATDMHNQVATERDTIAGTLNSAIQTGIKRHLRSSLIISRITEAALGISLAVVGVLVKDKIHTGVLLTAVGIVVILKLSDLFFSSKMGIMKSFWRRIFLAKVRGSDMYHSEATRTDYLNAANAEFDKVANNNLWAVKLK